VRPFICTWGVRVAGVCVLFSLANPGVHAERIVYPQAVVGAFGDSAFVIELRLGNRGPDPWSGTVRLLRQQDLRGMSQVIFEDAAGNRTTPPGAAQQFGIPPGESRLLKMSSTDLQIGVLVIEPEGSPLDALVASFYYKLLKQNGQVTDVIAIQGVRDPATGFRAMISDTGTFNVGLAAVAETGLNQSGGALDVQSGGALDVVELQVTVVLQDGTDYSGTVILGGGESGQKAFFPREVIPGLPVGIRVAQIRIRSTELIYVAMLALATPPESEDVQIGSAPALVDVDLPFTNLSVDARDRSAVIDFFRTYFLAPENDTSIGWTGDVATCTPGTSSAAFNQAILRLINFYRAMAGVPADILFDATLNGRCQQMALMMISNNQSSHNPPPTWTCFTQEGADAAARSNLFYFGESTMTPQAIVEGYIRDSGAGNTAVGHRRWILLPRQRLMGSGSADNGQRRANALWVISAFAPGPQLQSSWPPAGFVPHVLVYPRWSFSFPGADFSQATVTMRRGDTPVALTLEPIATGFGDNTIVWVPQGVPPVLVADVTYTVSIDDVLVGGVAQSFEYQTTLIDAGP
jgi:uncharacterized protein YkwD